jgi:hypothetical protein
METSGRTASVRTLEDLAGLGPDKLMDLYRTAHTPALEDLDGKLTGRMQVCFFGIAKGEN